MEAYSDQSGHHPQGWRNVSIMCDVESWGRVGNNMTFSMHKNITTQFMLLGHLNMTDEKDIIEDPSNVQRKLFFRKY